MNNKWHGQPVGTYISAQWLKHPNEKLTFLCNFHSAQSPVVFLQSHLWWVSIIDYIHCSLVHHLTLQTEPAPCGWSSTQLCRQQCTVCQYKGKRAKRQRYIKTHLICLGHGRHCSQSEMTLTALPVCKNSIE